MAQFAPSASAPAAAMPEKLVPAPRPHDRRRRANRLAASTLVTATALLAACGGRPAAPTDAPVTPTANKAAPTPQATPPAAILSVATGTSQGIGGSLVFTRAGRVYRFHPRSGRMEGPWLQGIVALAPSSSGGVVALAAPQTSGAVMELAPGSQQWRAAPWPDVQDQGYSPAGDRWAGTLDGAFGLAAGPGGPPIRTLDPGPFDPTLGLAWSADGGTLAYVTASPQGSTLHVIDADGRQLWSLGPEAGLRSPKWSPDGEKLAFILDPGAGALPSLWSVAARGEGRQPAPTAGAGVAVWIGWAGPWLVWAAPADGGPGMAVFAARPGATTSGGAILEGIDGPVVWTRP